MPHLFEPLKIRAITLKNRIMMAPMQQYSADSHGRMNDWHLVHYASRAVGGAGLVMLESTAVESRGRTQVINPGIFDDSHIPPLARIAAACRTFGATVGIQIGHSGRKARRRTKGHPSPGHEEPLISANSLPFDEDWATPHALTTDEVAHVVDAFRRAAVRALEAGFEVLEIHGAHGYLINQFLSPLTNHRNDEFGGSLDNRLRMPLRVVDAVRSVWPDELPLFFRVSAIDHAPGGIEMEEMVEITRQLHEHGVDLIDCSAGGLMPGPTGWPPQSPGFQVAYAERIRRSAGVLTGAVGRIDSPELADEIVRNSRADVVAIGRGLLRDPYWPLHASECLGTDIEWPKPYITAKR